MVLSSYFVFVGLFVLFCLFVLFVLWGFYVFVEGFWGGIFVVLLVVVSVCVC